jgi:hypothetical protein
MIFSDRLRGEGGRCEVFAAQPGGKEPDYVLAGAQRVSPLAVRSAASHRLTRAAGDSWVAVGDAAAGRLGGDGASLATYERRVAERFIRYWIGRRSFYALETRWPSATFWRRRQRAPQPTT